MTVPFAALQAALTAAGETHAVLPLNDGWRALVTQRGARILGLYPPEDGPGLLWINPALAAGDTLRSFITGGGWNLGGERVWLAPEIQFIIQDRRDFWGTHRLPPAIDPGHYSMTAGDEGVAWSQTVTLAAYNIGAGSVTLQVERRVAPARNPLHARGDFGALMAGVSYAGYTQTVHLEQASPSPLMAESWCLAQLPPGGVLLIPCAPDVESAVYFGSAPDEAIAPQTDHIRLPITGQRQYKTGYSAAGVRGVLGYYRPLGDGRASLLIRRFDNDPSAVYSEEPPDQPGRSGFSIHAYNDDGGMGGFGEMEASGRAIGGNAGRRQSADAFTLWAFVGPPDALGRICRLLTGVAP